MYRLPISAGMHARSWEARVTMRVTGRVHARVHARVAAMDTAGYGAALAARSQRPQLLQSVRVVAPKDPLEGRFLSMLTEDRAQHYMSYVEFLCHVHRQIQAKFN